MPTRTCGRRNISPRFQLVEDSLAPGKSRMGNLQLPPQIHLREDKKMLHQDISEVQRTGGGMMAEWEYNRHASELIPGSVTFVGDRDVEYGG